MQENLKTLPLVAAAPVQPLAEPKVDPIRVCRNCGACVTDSNPSPCQQERCGAWAS